MFFERPDRVFFVPRFLVASAFGLLLASCQVPWGERASTPVPAETKLGSEAKCLAGVMPVMTGFMNGTAEPEAVSDVWTCFDNALGLFERKVRGENPQAYSAREVARFFEDFFLAENIRIDDDLLVEIMRLKQLFVGGENQKMTREELGRLREFARQMRQVSLDLLPQMRIISLNWGRDSRYDLQEDLAAFETARQVAQKAVFEIASMIEPQHQDYELKSLTRLLGQLERLFGTHWQATSEIERLLPVLAQLKQALTGTKAEVIEAGDWRKFGQLGIRSYFLYLRYHYFFEENPNADEDPEFSLAVGSVDDAMSTLADILREKDSHQLSEQEMSQVTQAVAEVFPQLSIRNELVHEIFRLKSVLMGGQAHLLTPLDLERGRLKLEPLRQVILTFLKNREIFEGSWNPGSLSPQQAQADFQVAEREGLEMFRRLGSLLESSYDLQNVVSLVQAYEASFPVPDGSRTWGVALQKWWPIAVLGKQIVLAEEGSEVAARDWVTLFDAIGRISARYLEYRYFLESESLFRPPGLDRYQIWSRGVVQVFERILLGRGRGQELPISQAELKKTLKVVQGTSLWPSRLSLESVETLMPVLTTRFLTPPEARLKGRAQDGLSRLGLQTLMVEVDLWFAVQRRLNDLSQGGEVSHARLQAAFQRSNAAGDQELYRLVRSTVPFAADREGRLWIDPHSEVPYDEASLRNLNLVRALLRWVIRSYGDAGQIQPVSGLTQAQFDRVFADVRPFVVSLGLLEPHDVNFATSRFFEGNLFTPFSDGNQFLDFGEGGSLAMLILSGLRIHALTQHEISAHCQQGVLNGKPQYQVDCALEEFRKQAPKALAAMPGMQGLFSRGNVAADTELLNNVLRASGWRPNADRKAPMNELALVPHVLQYIESLYRRWDNNADGILDREEAMRAYPMFEPLLRRVSNLSDERMVRAAFAYILVKGKAPETFWEQFEFITGWRGGESSWPIQADRYQVGRILGFIADMIRQGQSVQIVATDPPSR